MFARIVTFQRSASSLDESARLAREQVIPLIRRQPGYRGAYVLVDRASGKQLGITLWDSPEHASGSAAHNDVRDQTSRDLGDATPPVTEVFEVDLIDQPTASATA
jgi:hypothetical protein